MLWLARLALVGGVFAVVLSGGVLNVATLVGFITLFGIAVRNGILLVSHYNHLLAEGVPLDEAVFRGMERLNPVLMTALSAGLALVPLALAGGEPGNGIQSPMAVVVLGGLLSAVVLNMLVVPALYRRYGVRGSARVTPIAEEAGAVRALQPCEKRTYDHPPNRPLAPPLPSRASRAWGHVGVGSLNVDG